ncbi:MAG: PAS domain S-box protein [Myxococcota bacterium]
MPSLGGVSRLVFLAFRRSFGYFRVTGRYVRARIPECFLKGTCRDSSLQEACVDAQATLEGQRAVFAELGGFSVTLDAQGRITAVSAGGPELLGQDKPALIGLDWFDTFVPPDIRSEVRRAFRRWLKREEAPVAHLTTLQLSSTRKLRVLEGWRVEGEGESARAICTVLGLPPDPEIHPAYARSLKELDDVRTALDVSSIVAITDRAGTITFVNEKFCEISKYTAGELLGKTHRVVNSRHHPPEYFQEMWKTIASGKVWKGDICNRAKDGTEYWVATTIVPFLGTDGRPYQYLAIRNDITDRKRMEVELVEANQRIRDEQRQLIQAEKMSSIGVLAAGVAHEINNPLSGVLSCVKALRDQEMEPAQRAEYFATVLDGLERIQQTVRGLLDYSRQRNPRPVAVELEEVVSAAVLLVTPAVRKKDLSIEAEMPRGARVYCDRAQLMQALVNVLLNAIYAAQLHGKVRVLELERPGQRGVCIIDDGPGIKPEVIHRVCDPFFTTKPEGEGTGLGLAVTLSLMRGNLGDLGIESNPGEGARVTLWLPKPAEG